MPKLTRRAALAGAAALTLAGNAHADVPAAVANDPGFRAWTPARGAGSLPLGVHVDSGEGPKRLSDWINGRPTVLALWATWCGPCLVEKPNQAALSRRLRAANARAQILILQTYDDVPLANARQTLTRLRATGLDNARAMPDAEAAFITVFGASSRDRTRTSMPSLLLIGSNGRELGRAVGTMTGVDGQTDYFADEATFQFLRRLS